uniref:hypothetical protein n=1 Tax=Bradyrhizobium sp. (strain ORS 278) TaxID=114615 RepID=UPI0012FF4016|nr:hypothetical protein [Bradyrhizobium sp. ORS 278]
MALAFGESPRAIRKKATVDARPNAHEGVCDENFFVAKIYDSESANDASRVSLPAARRTPPFSSRSACLQEMLAAQAFLAMSISSGRDGGEIGAFDFVVARRAASRVASAARARACQHFLKPEAVFFHSLVYR